MRNIYTKLDRQTTWNTHRFFWRANFVDKTPFVIWVFCRPPAMFIYYVLIPFQIAYALQAIITKHFDQVGHYAIYIILMGILYCILWALGGVCICVVGKKGAEWLQSEVFSNYLNKDYEFFNNTYIGSLGSMAARLRDSLSQYNITLLNSVTRQVITVISSIIIIGYHSLTLAAATLIGMVLLLSFTVLSSKWRLKYRVLLSQDANELDGVMSDALSHGTTVKSFALEGYEKNRLKGTLSRWGSTQYWSWMTSIPADAGRIILSVITIAVLLLITSGLFKTGSIPIAIVILIQLYVIRLIMSTQEIAELVKEYDSIMSSAHQAIKTMAIKPNVIDKAKPTKLPRSPVFDIAFKKVGFRYSDAPKNVHAVKNFSLDIKQGEKIGLVGYSGSGKTTLTKLLLRFMDVTDGQISVAGIDIRDLTQEQLRSNIAYVPQEPLLFHRTIRENINYGRPSAKQPEVLAAGEAAYVDEFIKELKSGYDTLVGEKGIKLSGGQRQRVAIARALLRDAPILVLDEATSALDSRSELLIQKALWKLMEGRTALVIAHRLSTIQRLDRIVVMDKGKIIETGTHDELVKRSGIYAKLWEHQSGGYLQASRARSVEKLSIVQALAAT